MLMVLTKKSAQATKTTTMARNSIAPWEGRLELAPALTSTPMPKPDSEPDSDFDSDPDYDSDVDFDPDSKPTTCLNPLPCPPSPSPCPLLSAS